MKTLNIVTFIARNSADYANFLRRSLERFRSQAVDINYFYIESGGGDVVALEGWECLGRTGSIGHNSGNHGLALNYAFKKAQTIRGENWVFVDADIAVVYPDWDLYIGERLKTVDITGFSYGADGPRYQDFPCVFFCAFNDNILELDVEWGPRLVEGQEAVHRFMVQGQEHAEYLGVDIGSQIKCDTGWQLPLCIKPYTDKWEAWSKVNSNQKGHLLPFKDRAMRKQCQQRPEHMAEWHVNGQLFGSHKQASRSMAFNSDWGKIWRWRINQYCKQQHGEGLR
jgi:hypothetical protein